MNNKRDLKRIGLIIIAITSIIITIYSIFPIIEQYVMYGSSVGSFVLTFYMIDFTCLALAYYFSRKIIAGPIIGLIYTIFCMIIVQVTILYLILSIGYVLVLVSFINQINSETSTKTNNI